MADAQKNSPGFFAIFPVVGRILMRAVNRLTNPVTLASVEKSTGASGEKSEALVLLETELERNPHQVQHVREDAFISASSQVDLIELASRGDLYLPASKEKS